MYVGVAVLVLIVTVSANWQVPLNYGTLPLMNKPSQPEPEKCCSAAYYTYQDYSVIVSVEDGALFTQHVHQSGAYDSIAKIIAVDNTMAFPNGTTHNFKVISDYGKGVGYRIVTGDEETVCHKFPVGTSFPYNCVKGKYIGSFTVGNRALHAANWYIEYTDDPAQDVFVVYQIKHPECVDLGYFSRAVDKATGAELWSNSHGRYDYNLGICDPDERFKPPPECETMEMMTSVPNDLRLFLAPGGKHLMFE